MPTYPSENCIPGTIAGIWSARAPGATLMSSVSRVKQPCLVLMLFSFICLCRALTMSATCRRNSAIGLGVGTEEERNNHY